MQKFLFILSLSFLTIACEPTSMGPDSCQNSPSMIGRTWIPKGYDPDKKDNELAKIRFDKDGFLYVETIKDDPYTIENCNILIETQFGPVTWEIITLNSAELIIKNPFTTITYN